MRVLLSALILTASLFGGTWAQEQPTAELILRGRTYIVTPYVWRDYMPILGPSEPPRFYAYIRVTARDGRAPDSGISATAVTVRRAGREATLQHLETRQEENAIVSVFRRGPDWTPGGTVDVRVRIGSGKKVVTIRNVEFVKTQ